MHRRSNSDAVLTKSKSSKAISSPFFTLKRGNSKKEEKKEQPSQLPTEKKQSKKNKRMVEVIHWFQSRFHKKSKKKNPASPVGEGVLKPWEKQTPYQTLGKPLSEIWPNGQVSATIMSVFCQLYEVRLDMQCRGLFRVSSVKTEEDKFLRDLDESTGPMKFTGVSAKVIANSLKAFLRNIPEGLMDQKSQSADALLPIPVGQISENLAFIRERLMHLPMANLHLFKVFLSYLHCLLPSQHITLMDSRALASVLWPSFGYCVEAAHGEKSYRERVLDTVKFIIDNAVALVGEEDLRRCINQFQNHVFHPKRSSNLSKSRKYISEINLHPNNLIDMENENTDDEALCRENRSATYVTSTGNFFGPTDLTQSTSASEYSLYGDDSKLPEEQQPFFFQASSSTNPHLLFPSVLVHEHPLTSHSEEDEDEEHQRVTSRLYVPITRIRSVSESNYCSNKSHVSPVDFLKSRRQGGSRPMSGQLKKDDVKKDERGEENGETNSLTKGKDSVIFHHSISVTTQPRKCGASKFHEHYDPPSGVWNDSDRKKPEMTYEVEIVITEYNSLPEEKPNEVGGGGGSEPPSQENDHSSQEANNQKLENNTELITAEPPKVEETADCKTSEKEPFETTVMTASEDSPPSHRLGFTEESNVEISPIVKFPNSLTKNDHSDVTNIQDNESNLPNEREDLSPTGNVIAKMPNSTITKTSSVHSSAQMSSSTLVVKAQTPTSIGNASSGRFVINPTVARPTGLPLLEGSVSKLRTLYESNKDQISPTSPSSVHTKRVSSQKQ